MNETEDLRPDEEERVDLRDEDGVLVLLLELELLLLLDDDEEGIL